MLQARQGSLGNFWGRLDSCSFTIGQQHGSKWIKNGRIQFKASVKAVMRFAEVVKHIIYNPPVVEHSYGKWPIYSDVPFKPSLSSFMTDFP